jgi:hypothetical protein
MTTNDFSTTTTAAVLPPFTADALPELQANVATAQVAGDLAHARSIDAGQSNYAASQAYHAAFAQAMHELGTPMPCSCNHCRAEAESAQVGGWLMVALQMG